MSGPYRRRDRGVESGDGAVQRPLSIATAGQRVNPCRRSV